MTDGRVTVNAVEEWSDGNPAAEVTVAAIEQWASPTGTLFGIVTSVAIEEWASAGGSFSGALSDSLTTSDSIDSPVVASLTDAGTLSDTVASGPVLTGSTSDSLTTTDNLSSSLPSSATITDSSVSSDSLSIVLLLADAVASDDLYSINYSTSLADTVASSDIVSIPVPFSDIVTSSDTFFILTDFVRALADTARSSDYFNGIANTGGVTYECGPIPIFPTVPESFPVKLSLVMDTTVGTTKSLREMRVPQQQYPLWDIELPFEELRDQTQNQTPYGPFTGVTDYEQLVQQWLMMYGQTGIFAFDAPWDDSRTDQEIAVGDGTTTSFPIFRTWATGSFATLAPIGLVNVVTNVKINGTIVNPLTYSFTRSFIDFTTAPANGAVITMTFSFYYVCRFTEDEQDFEEFSKNRWTVPSLKFRAVYWPGCQ